MSLPLHGIVLQVYQDDDFDVNRGIHLVVLNQATVSISLLLLQLLFVIFRIKQPFRS
jgi:hypothetical protein